MYTHEPAGLADSIPDSSGRPVRWIAPGTQSELIEHLRPDGMEFRPVGELRLVTERSVWLLRADTYFRMPKAEQTREQDWSIEGRMDDGRWHSYRRARFFLEAGTWLHVRILPMAGPVDGEGIYTGRILAIGGTWDEVEPELDGPDTTGGQP